jgi:hypothetical protein
VSLKLLLQRAGTDHVFLNVLLQRAGTDHVFLNVFLQFAGDNQVTLDVFLQRAAQKKPHHVQKKHVAAVYKFRIFFANQALMRLIYNFII